PRPAAPIRLLPPPGRSRPAAWTRESGGEDRLPTATRRAAVRPVRRRRLAPISTVAFSVSCPTIPGTTDESGRPFAGMLLRPECRLLPPLLCCPRAGSLQLPSRPAPQRASRTVTIPTILTIGRVSPDC